MLRHVQSRTLNSFRWLAFVLCLLALAGCSQKSTGTGNEQPETRPGSDAASGDIASGGEAITDPGPLPHFDGAAAMSLVREIVAFGPRWVGSPGHQKTEDLIRAQLKGDNVEEDAFTAEHTPAGPLSMRNYIDKFAGNKDGIIVVAGHYDTLYNRPDFVGADDAGSSTALPLQLAKDLRREEKDGKLEGYSVWLVWLDGEEAIKKWSDDDSLYGSRQLASKWQNDGTLKQIKAFLLVDMIGDGTLNIGRETNSTPWLEDLIYEAASLYGYQSHFSGRSNAILDDHMPFVQKGVPAADITAFLNYGYGNAFWHTKEDTLDKLSAKSFEISGSVVEETIRLLNRKPSRQ